MSQPGRIIEYIDSGKILTAVCLEEKKGRILALNEKGREVNLSPSRIVHVSTSRLNPSRPREELLSSMKEANVRREELKAKVSLEELWEVLHEEGGEYTARELAELAFNMEVTDDHVSAMVRCLFEDRLYFRFNPDRFQPNDPGTIQKILTQRSREAEKERELEEGSRWIRSLWGEEGEEPPLSTKESVIKILKEYALLGKNAPQAKRAEELLRRAGMTHELAAFQALVRLGIWSPDENLLLHRFGIKRDFPESVLEEARRLTEMAHNHMATQGLEDLTHLEVFTIDSPRTLDVDDGISIVRKGELLEVGIHITDVSCVIIPGSLLDQEAFHRATSIYLPEERIPMFPPEISEDICSLKEGRERASVSLILEMRPDGEIISYRFSLARIRVHRRLSYDEADLLIPQQEELKLLLRICHAIRKERVSQGALLLPIPEVWVRVNEGGELVLERRERETPSQIIVSELMILANRLTGEFLLSRGVSCIFRTQTEPKERIIEGVVEDLFTNYRQRKLLNRAEISLEPAFHHGLGVRVYTTVTSPLRRYLDLLVQRQLRATLLEETPPYTREELEDMAMELEETLGYVSHMEQVRYRYWLLKYLEGRKGESTKALVMGQVGNRVQLLLPEYMVETSIPLQAGAWLREGQEVDIRIGRVKAREDILRVELF